MWEWWVNLGLVASKKMIKMMMNFSEYIFFNHRYFNCTNMTGIFLHVLAYMHVLMFCLRKFLTYII